MPQRILIALSTLLAASLAQADITIGVTVSATGPAASLGIPERNTLALLPATLAGQTVRFVVLDDASDTTTAVKNARRLTAEDKVDVMIGSTTTPNSLAILDVAAETGTPLISLGASSRIVEPVDDKRRWVFKTPQTDEMMAQAIVEDMARRGVKTAGYLGFADAYGEGWWNEFNRLASQKGIKLVASERYNRTDTFVTGQVLKIIAARPDAVLIGGSGTPAALPQRAFKEKGYKGQIYQTHGVANNDFLRVGGKDVEGTLLPAGPVLVAAQLADTHPVKKTALEYVARYEGAHGAGSVSTFGAHAWDAWIVLQSAMPAALKKGKPGTPEFRAALRDALESVRNVAGAHGVFTMSAKDHLGLDQRAVVMVRIENGGWKLQ